MRFLFSTAHRWRLVVQFDWLAEALLAWTGRARHNAWMSAGEGLWALATFALIFWVELTGAWWALGLYPDLSFTFKHGAMVCGAILTMMVVAGVVYLTCEAFARYVFLTTVGHHDLQRTLRGESPTEVNGGLQRRLENLLALNPTCDLTPLEWWLARRVWSEAGARSLREMRLLHALPEPQKMIGARRERM